MIRLSSYLTAEHVHLDVDGIDKGSVLTTIGERLAGTLGTLQAGEITDLLSAREKLASTGVGLGVAIPHASSPALDRPCLGLFRTTGPVPFDAVDGEPVQLMMVVLAPQSSQALHLRLLARIARLVRSEPVRARLLTVDSAEQALALIDEVEGQL